jgi:tripartite-type tricarboxylate transporter receptor subunit TctC
VPFPSGGGTDAFARPLTAMLTRQIGKQVIVDNPRGRRRHGRGDHRREGGTRRLLLLHGRGAPCDRTVDVPQARIQPRDRLHPGGPDLQRAAGGGRQPAAHAGGRPEVLPRAGAQEPGKYNYGSAGNGTSHHLAGELFKLQTKTFITHIPYRGAGPALQDLIAGQVDMMFDGLGSSATHIKSGRIKALAVAASKRAPGFPDLPTSAEAGVPTYQVATWYGLWAPKGTPKDIVERMQSEMAKAFATPELQSTWQQLGTDTPKLYGDEFGRFVSSEIKRWAEVVKSSGAKLD